VTVPIQRVEDDIWLVDGRVIDDRLVTRLALDLPAEALDGFDTVAGLVLKAFGKIPSEGETTTYYGMELTVVRVKGHRVRQVRIRLMSPEEAEVAAQEKIEANVSQRRRTTRRINAVREGDNETAARKTLDEPELVAPRTEKENEQEPK
jgi:hypothetical protein